MDSLEKSISNEEHNGNKKNYVITLWVRMFVKISSMKVAIIRIGNSKGIRLNKMLLEKYQIEDEVELVLEPDSILIRPIATKTAFGAFTITAGCRY